MFYYYYCPVNLYYTGKDTFKVDNSTTQAPPEYNTETERAYFINGSWEIQKQKHTGVFINKTTLNIVNEILQEELNLYWTFVDFKQHKKIDIQSKYVDAQKCLLINGRTIEIAIAGEPYRQIYTELSKSEYHKQKQVVILFQDINDKQRYIATFPRSFVLFLFGKIQQISFKNYKIREYALQQVSKNDISPQDILGIKYNYLTNNVFNINEEVDKYCLDSLYQQEYPQDIEYMQSLKVNGEYHFFEPLTGDDNV